MTSHLLLDELDESQKELIRLIGRPIVTDRVEDQLGWPIWDFVRRKFERNQPGENAEVVLVACRV